MQICLIYDILLVSQCCGTLGTAVNEAYFALFSMRAHVTGMTPGFENTDFYISDFLVYLLYFTEKQVSVGTFQSIQCTADKIFFTFDTKNTSK